MKFHAKLDIDPEQLADRVSPLRAGERIRVLHEELGEHLVATTSFGLQAAVMLHLIHENAPEFRWWLLIQVSCFRKPTATWMN